MPAIERIINGTVPGATPLVGTINQSPPRPRVFYDIRTDATADSEISLSYSANPVIDFGPVGGLASPTYDGTILVADMNKVVEIVFDTPVSFITWTYSSASKKLYLAQFAWDIGSITQAGRA